MAENPWVPTPKRTYAEHDLWFPEPDEALTRAPTWLRRIGKTADGQAVTLAMVLEQEPASGHEDRIGEHRQALEAMIELSEAVLGSTPIGATARGPVGFNLLAFAGELASARPRAILALGAIAHRAVLLAFGLAVLFVFLLLSALYESWLLPLAVILIVPMCILAAMIGAGCLVGGDWIPRRAAGG